MKVFYYKLVIFVSILLFIILLSANDSFRLPIARLTDSDEFITSNNGPDEIGPYIDKARESSNYTKLILGDSVCHQMFSGLQDYNDDICILGSNAAVTMAGQYILLHEFLESHDKVTDVWLIIIPRSMSYGFDKICYMYVVMPNVEKESIGLLDENTLEILADEYGPFFMNPHVVWFLDRSAPARKLYLNSLHGDGYGFSPMSPVAVQYINKMISLCNERNIRLHLLSGPESEERKEFDADVLKEFNEMGYDAIFPDYGKSIRRYPDEQFIDGVHFGGEYANQESYNEKIKQMGDESLLEYLKFE